MCQFVETIRAEHGRYERLDYHSQRMNVTGNRHFSEWEDIDLGQVLPPPPQTIGRSKVRVVYGRRGISLVESAPYHIRVVRRLRIVTDDAIDYTYKSTDRASLNRLRQSCADDEEILIVKNGLLTDTSYTNIALWDGREWHTPARPLLGGTMRASLIDSHRLVPVDIPVEHLAHYHRIALFNALIDLGEMVVQM